MPETTSPFLTRRSVAKSVLMGGAGLVSSAALFAQSSIDVQNLVNVRQLGAKGDGKTEDTKVLQAAIDSASSNKSAVFVPPGEYLTRELHMRPGLSLVGFTCLGLLGSRWVGTSPDGSARHLPFESHRRPRPND
jgi:polygalacturonase